MRILLLTHAFNSLAQRLHVELRRDGHELSVELDVNDRVTEEAVALFRPDLVVAPFLKRAIPESVWRTHRCIIVHPGIAGDRGPSALDWAILRGETAWGVTALQANGEMDAGDIFASVSFPMRPASKSSLYRNEVTEAAVGAIRLTIRRIGERGFVPQPLDYGRADVRGRPQPAMKQSDRAIDWERDDTDTVLRKVRAADGAPGVLDTIAGCAFHLCDAHREDGLRGGVPGAPIARRQGAVCRATRDGAVWITHLKRAGDPLAFKLPAALALGGAARRLPRDEPAAHAGSTRATWRDIEYVERGPVGLLHFRFYNGAMSTSQCIRLRRAYRYARARPTRAIVLMGGEDFWCNGIHLNLIEAAEHPAEESWRNINAMNDIVRDIVCTRSHHTIAAMRGNAGAGGVFLALAADEVIPRAGIVLNPHYKDMGNLYGSEYWTYLLPRRVGAAHARAIVGNRLPVGTAEAASLGLVDEVVCATGDEFALRVEERALVQVLDARFFERLAEKARRRAADEGAKPLAAYRAEELARMRLNFFGFDPSYHVARYNFVHKVPRSRTPLHLARHRALRAAAVPAIA